MKYVMPILALFVARYVSSATFSPEGRQDLAWQQWLGGLIVASGRLPRVMGAETFSAPGAPWLPQEWLFSIVAFASSGPWWYVFSGSCAFAATAALYLGAMRAQRSGASSVAIAVTLACAGVALFESFGVRVQVFGWLFLSLFLWFIEADGFVAYWSIAIVAVWSNVHGSVMLAPFVAGVVCVGNVFDEGFNARTKRLVTIFIGLLIATCVNPLGWGLPRFAILLFLSPVKSMITEWRYPNIADGSFEFGVLPLLLLAVIFGVGGSSRWKDRFLLATFSLLMFSAARNVAVFGIACFPLVARSISQGPTVFAKAYRGEVSRLQTRRDVFTPVLSILLAVVVVVQFSFDSRTYPVVVVKLEPALAAIRSLPGERNVFCADFAWCSGLLGTLRDRVFLDGRVEPYSAGIWSDFATISRLKPGWDRALHVRHVDVILVGMDSPLEQALELSADWHSCYKNTDLRVWVSGPQRS